MIQVITHRGLDPAKGAGYFSESSREAFEDQLARGYGLEFDVRMHEGGLVVAHDADLSRITRNGSVVSFSDMLTLVAAKQAPGQVSALHLKHSVQEPEVLERAIEELRGADLSKLIAFDVRIETAKKLKEALPQLMLAPSVAHPYDIERYNSAVGGTLYTAEEAIANRNLFDWVWLDEWDLADKDAGKKTFYKAQTFERLRAVGFNIALVTPELHATSPHLLGGESHEDARDHETLMRRIKEIVDLKPNAICTDDPDEVRHLAKL